MRALALVAVAGLMLLPGLADSFVPPSEVCLSYWYCIPRCWQPAPPDDNCWCRPECAPAASGNEPSLPNVNSWVGLP
jgi:hypothetical protein